MCFTITTPEKIAKRDIVCYKRLIRRRGQYTSVYQGSFYMFGKVYKTVGFGFVGRDVFEGRHSYSNLKQAKRLVWDIEVIVKCIIPKGTKYYYNPGDKEYVSLAIKLVKEL